MTRNEIDAAVGSGLEYLRKCQLPYGEFPSYVYTDRLLATEGKFDSSPFMTSHITYSLGFLSDDIARSCIEHATGFLIDELEALGLILTHVAERILPVITMESDQQRAGSKSGFTAVDEVTIDVAVAEA